ncbi:nuclear transport factor 2 family protein [Streptomyces sp. 769]|uniref:nuclear transport factor 2 family protein n=1 Tax=Streptomyces sp. 769 TaxID=1262452 RepID=UPI0005820701|nr:nuclear transport factor 2 family protein [Streptomyces sp. 769]AJC61063.1 limonene-1 C2-epoxide hydrolase catalytic domain protein [Streptomyces sp. 769]
MTLPVDTTDTMDSIEDFVEGSIEDFAALEPFFRIVQKGLAGLVDGEHFFDCLAEDVVVEYVVTVPGYPRRVEGRGAVADLYRGYGDVMVLHSAGELAVHHAPETSVVVLEYAVHGRAVHTGRAYDNHFVSVITVADRKVTHWRDYLDPVAVFQAIGWPAEHGWWPVVGPEPAASGDVGCRQPTQPSLGGGAHEKHSSGHARHGRDRLVTAADLVPLVCGIAHAVNVHGGTSADRIATARRCPAALLGGLRAAPPHP